VISIGSVVFREILAFTTIREICFRSRGNSNDWNKCSLDRGIRGKMNAIPGWFRMVFRDDLE